MIQQGGQKGMVPTPTKVKKPIKNEDKDKSTKKKASAKKDTDKTKKVPKKAAVKKSKKSSKKQAKAVKKDKKAAKDAKDTEEEEVEIVDEEMEEEEEVVAEPHLAKLKPKLGKEVKNKLRLKHRRKKQQPKFKRQEWFRYKRLGESWRKPKGLHSKMRKHKGYRPNVVRVGYGSPKLVRGLHPSGFREVMVYNVNDLEGIDPNTEAVRIGHSVGTKKRIELEKKAEELGIRVLNKGA
jgi:large subunit ribosomal protein L32e